VESETHTQIDNNFSPPIRNGQQIKDKDDQHKPVVEKQFPVSAKNEQDVGDSKLHTPIVDVEVKHPTSVEQEVKHIEQQKPVVEECTDVSVPIEKTTEEAERLPNMARQIARRTSMMFTPRDEPPTQRRGTLRHFRSRLSLRAHHEDVADELVESPPRASQIMRARYTRVKNKLSDMFKKRWSHQLCFE
jgi:hypothetical protein